MISCFLIQSLQCMVAKQIISFQDLTVSRKTTNCYDASDFLRLVKQLAKHSLLGSSNSPDEDLRLTSVRIVAREQGRLCSWRQILKALEVAFHMITTYTCFVKLFTWYNLRWDEAEKSPHARVSNQQRSFKILFWFCTQLRFPKFQEV